MPCGCLYLFFCLQGLGMNKNEKGKCMQKQNHSPRKTALHALDGSPAQPHRVGPQTHLCHEGLRSCVC